MRRDHGTISRTFYLRRAFRILPIYVAFCLAFPLYNWLAQAKVVAMPWFVYATFTQNIWLRNRTWENIWLTHTWSLAVEEQFYLTLPALIWWLQEDSSGKW